MAMRARLSRPDREESVQEKDSLFRPVREVAIRRFGNAEIFTELAIHVRE